MDIVARFNPVLAVIIVFVLSDPHATDWAISEPGVWTKITTFLTTFGHLARPSKLVLSINYNWATETFNGVLLSKNTN